MRGDTASAVYFGIMADGDGPPAHNYRCTITRAADGAREVIWHWLNDGATVRILVGPHDANGCAFLDLLMMPPRRLAPQRETGD